MVTRYEWDSSGPVSSCRRRCGYTYLAGDRRITEITWLSCPYRADKEILWTAALLHDVEKRSTTVIEEDGSITAKGHARKGEYTVRTLLYKDVSTPFIIREKIASFVRFHGLPLWLMEKQDPVRQVARAAFRVDTAAAPSTCRS